MFTTGILGRMSPSPRIRAPETIGWARQSKRQAEKSPAPNQCSPDLSPPLGRQYFHALSPSSFPWRRRSVSWVEQLLGDSLLQLPRFASALSGPYAPVPRTPPQRAGAAAGIFFTLPAEGRAVGRSRCPGFTNRPEGNRVGPWPWLRRRRGCGRRR